MKIPKGFRGISKASVKQALVKKELSAQRSGGLYQIPPPSVLGDPAQAADGPALQTGEPAHRRGKAHMSPREERLTRPTAHTPFSVPDSTAQIQSHPKPADIKDLQPSPTNCWLLH